VGPEDVRRLILALQDVDEQKHMSHPDFRVRGRIIATLGRPDARWAIVKLTPKQQDMLISSRPDAYRPASGAWGRRGSTLLLLEAVQEEEAAQAIRMAWATAQR